MTDEVVSTEVTSDDKLWALLSYIFSPVIPLVIMFLMPDKKDRPFLRYHSVQALVFGVVGIVISAIASITVVLACIIPPLYLIAAIFYGFKAYQGNYVTIPVITNFAKQQGWM
jgi:uncharacterized protein